MTMRLTQGQAKHIKRLWASYNKMGKALAELTIAIVSDSDKDIEAAHKAVLIETTEIDIQIEGGYTRMIKSTPGPKRRSKKGGAK
jgi:hypothetical protein